MKKFVFVFTAASLLIGAGCSSAEPVAVQPPQVVEKECPAQPIVYKDPTYGFNITMPAAWAHYTVAYREIDWGASGKSDSLDVGLPGDDSLFNIAVLTKAQWDKIQDDKEVPSKGLFIGEKGGYIFVGSSAQSVSEQNKARFEEITKILTSLK